MDLSKAYDCLPHELLIAKLAAYGVGHHSLSLLHDYLSDRRQRVRIGSFYSDWLEITLGVPQGSILGPLLFNIFINDLLFFVQESEICNFADDNTLFAFGSSVSTVRKILDNEISNVLNWFDINSMAANPAKFQIMFLGTKEYIPDFYIQGVKTSSSDCVKLLGVVIDSNLNFQKHVSTICNKAGGKTKALLRIKPYISSKTAMSICNAYILSQFNYCQVIWMGCDKTTKTKIDKVHLRALRAVHGNFNSSLSELLALENGVTFHIKFIQKLLTEIYKSLNGLNPPIIQNLFLPKTCRYTLRSGQQLILPPTKTVKFGTRSVLFLSSLTWNSLPREIKDSSSVGIFNQKLKLLKEKCCSCTLCSF